MIGALAIFRRELMLAWAGGSGLFLPAAFFAGAIFLGPLGIGTEPRLLSAIAPGMIFVALCLASLTTLERIFQADLEIGAQDHQRLSGVSMELVAVFKVLAHWLISGLPLALLTPVAGVMMRAETVTITSILPVLIGSLTIYLWGGVGASLTAGLRRSGPLVALLVLPFFVPVVIFGAEELTFSFTGEPFGAGLTLLAANMLGALAISPFAMAAALKLD
ncbi:MAG: heme exporter protein CcmB [Ponticaulis sp.]|nr:heme exporter protein CcmB [Ponticaulis sp.]|tara:strand:- start:7426 stop:8082 length:657 start_codon:yes stop_codon:yes gene_type:complete